MTNRQISRVGHNKHDLASLSHTRLSSQVAKPQAERARLANTQAQAAQKLVSQDPSQPELENNSQGSFFGAVALELCLNVQFLWKMAFLNLPFSAEGLKRLLESAHALRSLSRL
jgi:hypothetical protein